MDPSFKNKNILWIHMQKKAYLTSAGVGGG
jgi:hypothetical protein